MFKTRNQLSYHPLEANKHIQMYNENKYAKK